MHGCGWIEQDNVWRAELFSALPELSCGTASIVAARTGIVAASAE